MARRRELRPLVETLSDQARELLQAIRERHPTAHAYQGEPATHTVRTPYGSFQVCRACYVGCLRTYPGSNIATPGARCQCEHDKHFGL
jgi:hypothetical protein